MFTTTKPACEEPLRAVSVENLFAQEAAEANGGSEDESDDDGIAPLAGFGCGLPLSRNYASDADL